MKDAQGNCWQYRYDALGRRTEKRCEQKGLRIIYLWDGDNIAEIREYRDGSLQKIRHRVFNGRELTAQQDCTYSAGSSEQDGGWQVETRFAVCAATGQPLALFNTAGERIWRRSPESLWGMAPERAGQNAQHDPGLKFAGQQWDAESGLHYNRFRYYDPQTGCYLTPDPIGLLGGENTYGYVPNPLSAIDPLGLATCSVKQRVLDNVAASKAAREASGFSSARKSAEVAADRALASGKMTGAAAELRIGNRVFTGVSGEVVTHNPQVTAALMGTPNAQRAPWHGACAEIVCLDKALNAGVNIIGASSRAVNVGVSGLGHNTAKAACTSCNDILTHFGVIIE